jgi:hypothetical protein
MINLVPIAWSMGGSSFVSDSVKTTHPITYARYDRPLFLAEQVEQLLEKVTPKRTIEPTHEQLYMFAKMYILAERDRCAKVCENNAYEVGAALAEIVRRGE